ncbi:MAG: hypothetical protein NTV76_18565, partial [Pseudomonas sp.]|nr:hypothetical protein [Pseudomonas sp.]
ISGGAASSAAPNVITISVQVGAKGYNIYKSVEGTVYGYIGTAYNMAGIVLWHDIGATPDTTDQPPFFLNPFPTTNDQPSCVGMYQQRRCYGNTNNNPEQVQASRSGSFKNFTTSIPGKDDDSVSFTAAGNQVNAVKHLASLGSLIVFTQAGELSVAGDANGALTPSSINLRQHSNCGSSDLRPLIVDSEAVFVQARGNRVRNLRFDWQVNGYRGVDLCIFSDHLLLGYTIVDWAFSQVPNSIIWAVRSDGTLLGFTYLLEQQLAGWHRHDFDGTVENVCVIPESGEDYLYLVIKRSVNGRSVRYVERMASRLIQNIVDYIPTDCSLSFDGRITDGTTATLSGGTNWDYSETLTLTANASKFYATDVGQGVILTCADGTILRFTIAGYTSGTVVTGKVNKTVPVASRSVAITTWAKALITIKGLWHLVGKKLSVVGDGLVAASPNNSAYKTVTVSSLGQAALDQMYAVIHA